MPPNFIPPAANHRRSTSSDRGPIEPGPRVIFGSCLLPFSAFAAPALAVARLRFASASVRAFAAAAARSAAGAGWLSAGGPVAPLGPGSGSRSSLSCCSVLARWSPVCSGCSACVPERSRVEKNGTRTARPRPPRAFADGMLAPTRPLTGWPRLGRSRFLALRSDGRHGPHESPLRRNGGPV